MTELEQKLLDFLDEQARQFNDLERKLSESEQHSINELNALKNTSTALEKQMLGMVRHYDNRAQMMQDEIRNLRARIEEVETNTSHLMNSLGIKLDALIKSL